MKGHVKADSCSTVNIIDEEKFQRIQNASTNKIKLGTTSTEVYPYGQEKPLLLVGCFETEIESLSTGNKISTNFVVAKGNTNSRPLISLESSVELGVLMIANALQPSPTLPTQTVVFNQPSPTRTNQAQLKTSGSIDNLVYAYQDVFAGLGKHKIKARLIVDESVTPVAHKQRKVPYNLNEKAKREEQRLVEMGIIEAVPDDQPTTWCTNPVIAPKPHNPEGIRCCSDMRAPNTAMKRPVTEVPKLSTAYEPDPCKIEEVKGSMITARRSSDGRRVTRNNSHFKRVSGGGNDQLDQDPWDFEAHECNDASDAPDLTCVQFDREPSTITRC